MSTSTAHTHERTAPPLVLPETRFIHSVEALLTTQERQDLLGLIDAALDGRRPEFDVGSSRPRSVHEIDGESLDTVVQTYEPKGRIEFDELPAAATAILDRAVARRLPGIRVAFPAVRAAKGWFYVEYGQGQFVTPHVDYPVDADHPEDVKYAAISVTLRSPDSGGEFFIETTGHDGHWQRDGMMRTGADMHATWFRDLPRTRWRTSTRPGDALCWGTHVIHGTEPVRSGVGAKVIALLH